MKLYCRSCDKAHSVNNLYTTKFTCKFCSQYNNQLKKRHKSSSAFCARQNHTMLLIFSFICCVLRLNKAILKRSIKVDFKEPTDKNFVVGFFSIISFLNSDLTTELFTSELCDRPQSELKVLFSVRILDFYSITRIKVQMLSHVQYKLWARCLFSVWSYGVKIVFTDLKRQKTQNQIQLFQFCISFGKFQS